MKNLKFISLAVISVVSANFLTSCQKDNIDGPSDGSVRLTITTDSDTQLTKAGVAAESFETVDLSTDDIRLFMSGIRTVNTSNPFGNSVVTKGVIADYDTLVARNKFDISVVGASKTINAIATPSNEGNCPNGEYWNIKANDTKVNWQDFTDDSLTFWAYSYPNVTYNYSQNISFNGFTRETGKDAEYSQDFLVGYGEGQHYVHGTEGYNVHHDDVDIHFSHALAAIRFIVGEELDGYTLKSIAINNIYEKGSFSVTGSVAHNQTNGKHVPHTFVWTPEGTKTTLLQNYETTNTTAKAFIGTESESTFFVVPQAQGEISFTFTFVAENGKEIALTTNKLGLKETANGKDTFMAGYTYTYRIGSSTESVDISIIETINNATSSVSDQNGDQSSVTSKSNVYINNNKTAPVFVRVAVVANWYKGSKVVSSYNTPDFSLNNENWEKGEDGFYYYKRILNAGENTTNLIASFNKPSGVAGEHLEMKIIAQAIRCTNADLSATVAFSEAANN